MKRSNHFYFWALEPEAGFYYDVIAKKQKIMKAVGKQLYLDHQPHTTIYLASFPDENLIQTITEKFLGLNDFKEIIHTNGWHVFFNDGLTGKHTLVISFKGKSVEVLQNFQLRLTNYLSPQRDIDSSNERYSKALSDFSLIKQNNIKSYGFPFVGGIWHPHITIASISKKSWQEAWQILIDEPIATRFYYTALILYRLDRETPIKIASFPL